MNENNVQWSTLKVKNRNKIEHKYKESLNIVIKGMINIDYPGPNSFDYILWQNDVPNLTYEAHELANVLRLIAQARQAITKTNILHSHGILFQKIRQIS